MTDIDVLDYAILVCLDRSSEPLWKKRVHDRLEEEKDRLPGDGTASPQTVGRRIDQLQDDGLLEAKIANPDELNRGMIITYRPTQQGKAAIRSTSREFLRQAVVDEMQGGCDVDTEQLELLLARELAGGKQFLNDLCRDELVSLAAILLSSRFINDRLSSDAVNELFGGLEKHAPGLLDCRQGS